MTPLTSFVISPELRDELAPALVGALDAYLAYYRLLGAEPAKTPPPEYRVKLHFTWPAFVALCGALGVDPAGARPQTDAPDGKA